MIKLLTLAFLFFFITSAVAAERLNPVSGLPQKIDPSSPPDGINMLQILLENQSIPLKETRCVSGKLDQNRTLQHELAVALGYGLDNKRYRIVLSGECKADQFELRSGAIVDAWWCKLAVVQQTPKGGFITSAIIDFVVKKDTWEVYPELIRCR